MQIFDIALAANRREREEHWHRTAYMAYLMGGAQEGETFAEYLSRLGFNQGEKVQAVEVESAEEAKEIADRIIGQFSEFQKGSFEDL